jgi:hypothetical protein
MAIDLFGMLLGSAASWAVGKSLDVLVECSRCGNQTRERIGNARVNPLGCRNCSHEVNQFTNACDFTVASNGRVAHIGLRLDHMLRWERDPAKLFSWPKEGRIYFRDEIRALYLQGRQFVGVWQLIDFNSGQIYHKYDEILTPESNDRMWVPKDSLWLNAHGVPPAQRDGRIFSVEIAAKSRFGDILCRERLLVRLWDRKGRQAISLAGT